MPWKSHLEVLLKEKIFWEKSMKGTYEGIHFLVKLQDLGLALLSCSSLTLMFVFASVAINVLTVAGLIHSVIAIYKWIYKCIIGLKLV